MMELPEVGDRYLKKTLTLELYVTDSIAILLA